MSTEAIIDQLRAQGYVVLREKSYRQAQERQRVADALRAAAERETESCAAWARGCCAEERRLRDRLTAVFAAAALLGVTAEQLSVAAQGIIPTDAYGDRGEPTEGGTT